MKLTEIVKRKVVVGAAPRPQKATTLVEAAKAYKKNIKAVLDNQVYFFRTSENHRPILDDESELHWYEQSRRAEERDSIFGNGNWLMAWTESEWADYPPRKWSYFATQDSNHAGKFGRGDQKLMIIPADSVKKFGYVPEDFNNDVSSQTFMAAVKDLLKEVESCLGSQRTPLLRKLGAQVFEHRGLNIYADGGLKPKADNVKKIVEALDEMLENIFQIQQRLSGDKYEDRLLEKLKEFRVELRELGVNSLIEFAEENLSPKARDAKLYTDFGQIKKSSSEDELWFEGSYLGFYWYGEDDVLEGLQLLYDKL